MIFIPPAIRENVFQSIKTYVRPLCPKMGERDTGTAIGGGSGSGRGPEQGNCTM